MSLNVNILIPVSKSTAAKNAAEYALGVFGPQPACNFVLLNTFKIDILGNSGKSYSELKQDAMLELEQERARLIEFSNLPSDRFILKTVEARLNYVNNLLLDALDIEIVVLGTAGISQEEKYLGTLHAGELVISLRRSVLVIPETAKFHGSFKHVLFATDYNKPLNRKGADAMFTVLNGAVTHVLHVNDHATSISDEQQMVKQSILNLLVGHTVEIIEETETVESVDSVIQQQAKKRNVDAIVVMPYHNSFFERIFHASISRRLAQAPAVPILAIHD